MIDRLRDIAPRGPRPLPPGGLEAAIAAGRRRRTRAVVEMTSSGLALTIVAAVVAVVALTGSSGPETLATDDSPTPTPAASTSASPSFEPSPTTTQAVPSPSPAPTATPGTQMPGQVAGPGPQATARSTEALVIGAVGAFSGPTMIGPPMDPPKSSYREALVAWADHVNASGGIAGHRVELTTLDDQGDPAQHRVHVKKLLADPRTVALVAMSGAVTDDTAPARAAGVALIGATPTAAAILGSSNMFLPSETSAPALTYGYLADAVAAGGRNLAVLYCQEDSGCGAEHDAAVKSGYAKAAGLSVVMDQPVSIAQPDFTSECLSARSAGADTMLVIVDANTVRRVVTSCERQNVQLRYLVTPAQVTVSSAGPPPDGLLTTYPVAPWFVKDTPATAERARVIDPDAGSAQAYSSAELFRAVVEHAGDDVSRAGILAAARSLRAETTGGLTPPVAVGGPVRCWFSLLTRGGTWTAPHGTQVRCGPKP